MDIKIQRFEIVPISDYDGNYYYIEPRPARQTWKKDEEDVARHSDNKFNIIQSVPYYITVASRQSFICDVIL